MRFGRRWMEDVDHRAQAHMCQTEQEVVEQKEFYSWASVALAKGFKWPHRTGHVGTEPSPEIGVHGVVVRRVGGIERRAHAWSLEPGAAQPDGKVHDKLGGFEAWVEE